MPRHGSATSSSLRGDAAIPGGPSVTGVSGGVPPVEGPHAFALPASHSVRLAQAAALAVGALALIVLGLRFVDVRFMDLRDAELPPTPPTVALDRPEVDLPSLMKPVRSEGPRFREPAFPPDEPAPVDAAREPVAAAAAPPAREPTEAMRAAPVVPDVSVPHVSVPHVSEAHAAEARVPEVHAAEIRAPEAAFVGVWGPDDSACTPRTNRAGYLPAVITAEGAFAGETSCAFRNARPVPGGWSVSAACRSPKGRWTTQVRLAVAGRRLTWSSARGAQTYVRCGPSAAG